VPGGPITLEERFQRARPRKTGKMHKFNALIPELAVSDCGISLAFYRDVLEFSVVYQRPEEGFAFLARGEAQLMIDQVGQGRTFDVGDAPREHPFGRGLNVQIRVDGLDAMLATLRANDIPLVRPLEEKWYRRDKVEIGNRQFVVADPDGYLLRFFEPLGRRRMATANN
jgi:catechol 2,3-dioxygenase-like lactoylglutathione lyase family enzyme